MQLINACRCATVDIFQTDFLGLAKNVIKAVSHALIVVPNARNVQVLLILLCKIVLINQAFAYKCVRLDSILLLFLLSLKFVNLVRNLVWNVGAVVLIV